MATTRTSATAALRGVVDPELGVDIVTLGLIYDVRVALPAILVRMTMTTPFCPLEGYFRKAITGALAALPGGRTVNLDFTFDPPWTPARIAPAVRAQLGLR